MIQLTGLNTHYGDHHALQNINLQVKKGEVVVIIGPSGSGKSTLLRSINFLETPSSGTIQIDDCVVDAAHPHKKDILALRRHSAMVFQQYGLFAHKTALQNVMEGLVIVKKMPKAEAEKIATRELNKVGLGDRLNHAPAQLSGGQQQRVAIARALALNPNVILFDEPTSALDPELVGEVLETLKNIAKDGMTMMIVTHEIQFAKEVADRVIFMADGAIVEEGSVTEVLDKPTHARTKQFLQRIQAGYSDTGFL